MVPTTNNKLLPAIDLLVLHKPLDPPKYGSSIVILLVYLDTRGLDVRSVDRHRMVLKAFNP